MPLSPSLLKNVEVLGRDEQASCLAVAAAVAAMATATMAAMATVAAMLTAVATVAAMLTAVAAMLTTVATVAAMLTGTTCATLDLFQILVGQVNEVNELISKFHDSVLSV